MRKSDKKIDKELCVVLTHVCEVALKKVKGFQWLTHLVNYSNFPQSLQVVCVFDSKEHLDSYLVSKQQQHLVSLIQSELNRLNIKLKPINKHVSYDTEEACLMQHNGNWATRLASV
ncbi:Fis family transcriptional regulator [Litorilituus lipolyticus]|uniref:Fis family transcriptional regulator n=1 Tax=Litorilituus lipolyticus TaxID=2491017 RepID=A0A502KPI7_9GAMM|nr:Fis family transcriptional regulator [Litorilituus lipolyticus]TPH13578.1 Fis family transcriptional regulator [Litorilituus lipolyticus]